MDKICKYKICDLFEKISTSLLEYNNVYCHTLMTNIIVIIYYKDESKKLYLVTCVYIHKPRYQFQVYIAVDQCFGTFVGDQVTLCITIEG